MRNQAPSQWYREQLEALVRARLENIAERIIAHLKKVNSVYSFNELFPSIKGDRNEVLFAWNVLRRNGEVARLSTGRYCLAGIDRRLNELAAKNRFSPKVVTAENIDEARVKVRNVVGDRVRRAMTRIRRKP